MTYRGWQFDPKEPLSKSVQDALNNYIKKNGLPSRILLEDEFEIETSLKDVPVPEGVKVNVHYIDLPANIILVGQSIYMDEVSK